MAGDEELLEQKYYSVGGGFIEWEGYTPPQKGAPQLSLSDDGRAARSRPAATTLVRPGRDGQRGLRFGQERGRGERLSRQDHRRDAGDRRTRASKRRPSVLPGPIQLKTKAGDVYRRAQQGRSESQRAVGLLAAYALAGSEENARGHLVVTAPTGGSAGVIPALVYSLGRTRRPPFGRKDPRRHARRGGGRLSRQAQCDPVRGRRRLPGRNRCRLGHGRRDDRPGLRRPTRRWWRTPPNRRSSTISA